MTQWTPITGLKNYSRVIGRKAAFIALAWIVVYWISQPFRLPGEFNALMFFAPMIGAIAGVVAGWYVATNSGEDSGMTGLPLWVILVITACAPMWLIEGLMLLITKRDMGFGGWMLVMAATILAMAAAVWHSTSQE